MSFIEIFTYKTSTGKRPYASWECELDEKTRAVVKIRLDRIRLGNFGDTKKLSAPKVSMNFVSTMGLVTEFILANTGQRLSSC